MNFCVFHILKTQKLKSTKVEKGVTFVFCHFCYYCVLCSPDNIASAKGCSLLFKAIQAEPTLPMIKKFAIQHCLIEKSFICIFDRSGTGIVVIFFCKLIDFFQGFRKARPSPNYYTKKVSFIERTVYSMCIFLHVTIK